MDYFLLIKRRFNTVLNVILYTHMVYVIVKICSTLIDRSSESSWNYRFKSVSDLDVQIKI